MSLSNAENATTLLAGASLAGTGKVWVDDLELLVDGKPINEAPSRELPLTALDRDREFTSGSRIHLEALSDLQVENLATLAEVWGFLKYHHPAVTSGARNWDFDLCQRTRRLMVALLRRFQ